MPTVKLPIGILLAIYLFLISVILAYLLFALWPPDQATVGSTQAATSENIKLFWGRGTFEFAISAEERLLLLVMIAAALGSYVHAATSFASYVGNQKFKPRWATWYVLRGPIGVALGVVLYFVFRAGLLTADAAATDTNPFGVLAIAALSGMFSKQATDKLDEVFKTLFRTEGDPRGDKLVHPVPTITRIEPPSVPAGATGVVLTISGEGFSEDSVVRLDAQERSMEYESSTRIRVPLAAEDTASARTFEVTVYNPDPGGGVSMLWPFTVAGTDGSSAPPDDPGG